MELKERTIRAAEAALADHRYVSFLDVLSGMLLLQPVHLRASGRMRHVDEVAPVSPRRCARSYPYFRSGPKYATASQIPELDQFCHMHYVPPDLPQKKLEKLRERTDIAPPTVFSIVHASRCGLCGAQLMRGDLLTMQENQPLCLECADLDHLVFLERGDTALTRRATRHSSLWAVVVRFSRSRNRCERQGVLVQQEALENAEQECVADAEERAARRVRDEGRREQQDADLVERMAEKIRGLYPRIPPREAAQIAAHSAARGSGRVGRSAAGRALDDEALRLAAAARVRHQHTRYDELLMRGMDRNRARTEVSGDIDAVLERWSIEA